MSLSPHAKDGDVHVPAQLVSLARLDPEVWFRFYGSIKNKEGKIIRAPKPNIVQRRACQAYRECRAAGRVCKMLGLKPRQTGLSTIAQGIAYHHFRTFDNLNGTLIADKTGTSDKVFDIFATFALRDRYPWPGGNVDPKLVMTDDVTLPNGSHYGKETAGSARGGAGGTIQVANMTEVAHYPRERGKDAVLGYLNSWYDGGEMSLAIGDSTPNGPQGWFYKMWTDKTNGWAKIFAAWFEFPEHSLAFDSPEERARFGEEMDDEEKEEMIRYGLKLEQMKWRAGTIADKCGGDPEKFKQEYPSNDVECFLKSMRPRFKLVKVEKMAELAAQVVAVRGEVTMQEGNQTAVFRPDDAGLVEVFESPVIGYKYVISMDVCTGEDQQEVSETADPDYHDIGVWRTAVHETGGGILRPPKLAAHHWSRLDIDLAAYIAAALSLLYGGAMIIPEVNGVGLAGVKKLRELGANVYLRTQMSGREQGATPDRKYGWRTDQITRKTIIDMLAQVIRDWKPEAPTIEIGSVRILGQMKTFVINEAGKPEAMPGMHDDGVLQTAIGVYNFGAANLMKEHRRKPTSVDKLNKREGWRVTA